MIVVKKFVFNPFMENTYVVWDEETKDAMIVDPGCSNDNEEQMLTSFIEERNLEIKYMVNTHCHIDHFLGCRFVKEKYNPDYFVPENDFPLLQNAESQASMFGIEMKTPPGPDDYLSERKQLSLGNCQIKLLFTPGHSPGEYSLYFEEEEFCITGDVLFQKNIGRTDLWEGNYNILIKSIKEKLFTLPDDVIVYSGHGENTTIGEEKLNNPFLNNLR